MGCGGAGAGGKYGAEDETGGVGQASSGDVASVWQPSEVRVSCVKCSVLVEPVGSCGVWWMAMRGQHSCCMCPRNKWWLFVHSSSGLR